MGARGGTQRDQQCDRRQTSLEKYLSMNYIRIQMEKVYIRDEKENAATVRT